MNSNPSARFDFIVVKPREGVDRAAIEVYLINNMGAKPDKVAKLLAHLAETGPVALEMSVTAERLAELKQKWDAAGLITTSKEALEIIEDAPVDAGKPMFTCPSCGNKQEAHGETDQCGKCGVFPHKFREEQRKKQLIQKERERLELMHHLTKTKEDQEAKELAEQAEIEAIRRKLEEEMGLNKKKKGFFGRAFESAGPWTKGAVGVAGTGAVLMVGWVGNGAMAPSGVSPEAIAKLQATQAKQSGEQMQKAVGQLIAGSKQMAKTSGAAAQFNKEIFAGGDRDADLHAQMEAVETGNANIKDSIAGGDRSEGLTQVAKTIAEAGGSVEDSTRALSMSMQSAKEIKEDGKRVVAVSAAAGAQFDLDTLDARKKAAQGDWRGADKAFSKAMNAATDITTKADAAVARTVVAKARADTGDYGGAALIFLEAMRIAEEVPDLRERGLALADVAKSMAEASNDLSGAPEHVFDKAMAVTKGLHAERDRLAVTNGILQRRIEAAGSIAGYLISTGDGNALKATLAQATKDEEKMTDPVLRARAGGTIARLTAESGDAATVEGILGNIAKLAEAAPEAQREPLLLAGVRANAEALAAGAKFQARKGDRPTAKKGFIQALQVANGIVTKSADPQIKSGIVKQRAEALSTIAGYMQAAGDAKAASRVFKLAMDTAGSK